MSTLLYRLYRWIYSFVQGGAGAKAQHELRYWKARKSEEGALSYGHYEYFFTTHFGLTRDFYKGKRILGCGPRGSLEWADMNGTQRPGIVSVRFIKMEKYDA